MLCKKLYWGIVIITAATLIGCASENAQLQKEDGVLKIDLAGKWNFRIDAENVGEKEQWFAKERFKDKINLPGSMQEQGYGNDVTANTPWTGSMWNSVWHKSDKYKKYRQPGNVKISFWLQPVKHYVGKAWYSKEIDIPAGFEDKQIGLMIERSHWETKVWVDGKHVDTKNSLSTPNRFDLGKLSPGKHRITVLMDNSLKIAVGTDAHSVSDNTQTNWNGLVGAIELHARDSIHFDDVQVYPDVERKLAIVLGTILNESDAKTTAMISLDAKTISGDNHDPQAAGKPIKLSPGENTFEMVYDMGDDCVLWDEFAPNVYQMKATVLGDNSKDTKTVNFGMRELKTEGTQFAINGRKMFFRGTLECSIFPLTGYPPTDVAEWERIIKVAQSYGLNHFRFHSWCPPQAAFDAADKLGFYFQAEGPFWARFGDGKPIDRYIYDEIDRILKEYGNHPSFMLLAYGNEPGGDNHPAFLGKLEEYWRSKDKRRLYSSGSGWPHIAENDYHIDPNPRIQHWAGGLKSRINALPPETASDYTKYISKWDVPVISHEIGQWCVYPNFKEMKKYTGVTRTKNFEIFKESLKENHMLDQADDFFMASGKLQALCYKEDIESALRTPGFGGYQLLDLHDFPGQGTALIGVVDPFWDPKPYISADEYRRFSGQTVPLARMEKRTWTDNETFAADIEIAHFGPKSLENATVNWKITDGDKVYVSGKLDGQNIPIGNGAKLSAIAASLRDVAAPAMLNLEVSIDGTQFANDWDFWVYPKTLSAEKNIHIVNSLDEEAMELLNSGKNVMLIPLPKTVKGKVALGFSSIFWNTAWTNGQKPHTLGILCDPKHPALADFPTQYHSNWQWWDIVKNGQAMVMNDLDPKLRPIVQVVDDWVTNRRLGLVFEAKVSNGKLLVCSTDLQTDIDKRPVAKQMLHSLKNYMNSKSFNPKHKLQPSEINDLFRELTAIEKLGAKVISTDSENSNYKASYVLDDNPTTFWNTDWGGNDVPGFPHEFVIDLNENVSIKGFKTLPRQDGNPNGQIGKYQVYISDGQGIRETLAAQGSFKPGKDKQTVYFDKVQTGRYLKFVAVAPLNPDHPWASMAEFEVLFQE